MRIALATCLSLPEPDPDEPLLVEALRVEGADVTVAAWDAPGAPFAGQDLVVLRSTWNYHRHLDAFLAWADAVASTTRLANPARVVRWNAEKTYLRDLEARGVAVVPTTFVRRAAPRTLARILEASGWSDVVVKPVVSAASWKTARFTRDTLVEGEAFLADLPSERDAMVQRWMPSVETYGERSLVWIDGVTSHAIRKSPRFAGSAESVSDEMPIAADERAFAEDVLARSGVTDELLYARVDIVRDPEGVLRVMELELVEPSLFLAQAPRALTRFAKAIMGRALPVA